MSAREKRTGWLVASALAASALAACSIGQTRNETVSYSLTAASPTRTCASPFVAPDLTTLAPCGDGAGHCYAATKTSLTGLPDCGHGDGTVCVPDPILTADGGKLKSCTFFIGNKPGACLSTLISDISAHQGQLTQDVCAANERCAPCIDPTDGTDTHVCEAEGVYEKDCTGGPGAEVVPCCHGAGECIDPGAVPSNQQGSLHRDICASGKLCAPADLVSGSPTSCSILGTSGVCIDVCFSSMLGPTTPVLRESCGPTEVCLPCLIGKTQGVPGC